MIDAFPESAAAYGAGWAVVAVDVLRATTTAVTIAARGGRCLPVASLPAARAVAARIRDPVLAGELGGRLPAGFHLQNSPCAIDRGAADGRPVILLSSSGTRVLCGAPQADAVYAASLRNAAATVALLRARHSRVAIVGAGTKGEFRDEDQLGCARIAAGLIAAGYAPADERTARIVARWRDAPVAACARGPSADYLRRTGQTEDLDFVLTHVDDVAAAFRLEHDELRAAG